MSPEHPMPPTRRRPIRGMASQPPSHPQPDAGVSDRPSGDDDRHGTVRPSASGGDESRRPTDDVPARWAAADYGTTRLVNFRIPVDLHDRFRGLVRESEMRHQRLRKPSLTELIIALLEEGPQTADEVAEMIRRKRAAEHRER